MPRLRFVSTLCAKRLQASDWVDISGLSRAQVTLPSGKSRLCYGPTTGKTPFPPNTRGFLYYHVPPKAPPLAGEIRFRCASNVDDFHCGQDLLSMDKFTPWSIAPYKLTSRSSYATLRGQLMFDNLIPPTMLDMWALVSKLSRRVKDRSGRPVLYYLKQPFFFRFGDEHIVFYPAANQKIGFCVMKNPLLDTRIHGSASPYSGSGWVRLEPYMCPRYPNDDRVALRIIKIVEPVQDLVKDYDGHVHRPTEGMLVQRSMLGSHTDPLVTITTSLDVPMMTHATVLPVNFDDLP
ncbi:hypothetical protein F5887DRAFT_1069406 [Amanita rubescens]|nr:hypothetical protein F5887DRAFT_1069406 [Amanita rubescens]